MIELLAGAAVFAADQAGKYAVEQKDELLGLRLGGLVEITRVRNYGFAMNRCEDRPKLVTYVTCAAGLLTAAAAALIWRDLEKGARLGLSIALGGAAGNIFDRLKRGYVVDFIRFPKLPKKAARLNFNPGDLGIFFGVILAILKS